MKKNFLKPLIFSYFLFMLPGLAHAAIFLDGSTTGCSNGSTNYNPATRSCSSGTDTVSVTLADFNSRMVAGATNYLRAGNYYNTDGSGYAGALNIDYDKSGTSDNRTIVKAYSGEERQAVIATASNKFQYNPDPADTSGSGSRLYYLIPAVSIKGDYVTVDGIKTYGQVIFLSLDMPGIHDSAIQNSDLGGGGSQSLGDSQGNVVKWNRSYNTLVKNNLIHRSCWGENDENSSAFISYRSSGIVENNTFYDNYGADAFYKDSFGQEGRTNEIRYNFFTESSIYSGVEGVRGLNQEWAIDHFLVHHNVFYHKGTGFNSVHANADLVVYSNTFVDNLEDITNTASDGVAIKSYNNLMYHSSSHVFYKLVSTAFLVASDYNIFNGAGEWLQPYQTPWATTFAEWKTYSSMDTVSINSNPAFINAAGSAVADFKRSSYVENFTGSPYGTHSGAYQIGNEIIGYTNPGFADLAAHAAPSGLSVL